MVETRFLVDLNDTKPGAGIGNKAEKLRFLMGHGLLTPRTHVCTWEAYLRYLADGEQAVELVRSELLESLDLGRAYAVRSSANVEDSLDFSFAGQFKSVLDVRGVDSILQAIRSVWASTRSSSVQAYLARHAIDPKTLKMAVMVQQMVPPSVSGVAFSKNPMTGLDEVIVEAVRGSGEALVQEGITPGRWINKWGAWISEPETADIGRELIQEVVDQTKSIAKAYGKPVDLEWVYDGQAIHWVQLREITSAEIDVYANHIAKEVFPGLIKPLIWSVNVPLVNGAWVDLFRELIGAHDIEANSLARSFYDRAYFNMGAIGRVFELLGMPRETLELLIGIEMGGPDKPGFKPSLRTYRLLPRMLRVALDKIRFERKIRGFLPTARAQYQTFGGSDLEGLSEQELLAEIDRLYDLTQEAAYFNIVTPLLMQIYDRVLKGQLSRAGVDRDRFDLTRGLEELAQFEPNVHLARLSDIYRAMAPGLQARIRESSYDELRQAPEMQALVKEIDRFLEQFGHLSDSGNDFSVVPWREEPDLIRRMVINYTAPEQRPADSLGFDEVRLSRLRRFLLRPIYRRARRFRLHREAVSATYTLGYGLFRERFFALGDHFVRRGIIQAREDILYLTFDEVRRLITDGQAEGDYQKRVTERKRDMEVNRRFEPPNIIYGEAPPAAETHTGSRLKGTPTSRGYYTGPARVVQGIRDFDKLRPGDVLVIPFSDVGWTPLFTKAGAVIAESGGILSHSSIVAREYGIPAVVSVSGACRLEDGSSVTVDGYRGEVIVHGSEGT